MAHTHDATVYRHSNCMLFKPVASSIEKQCIAFNVGVKKCHFCSFDSLMQSSLLLLLSRKLHNEGLTLLTLLAHDAWKWMEWSMCIEKVCICVNRNKKLSINCNGELSVIVILSELAIGLWRGTELVLLWLWLHPSRRFYANPRNVIQKENCSCCDLLCSLNIISPLFLLYNESNLMEMLFCLCTIFKLAVVPNFAKGFCSLMIFTLTC